MSNVPEAEKDTKDHYQNHILLIMKIRIMHLLMMITMRHIINRTNIMFHTMNMNNTIHPMMGMDHHPMMGMEPRLTIHMAHLRIMSRIFRLRIMILIMSLHTMWILMDMKLFMTLVMTVIIPILTWMVAGAAVGFLVDLEKNMVLILVL